VINRILSILILILGYAFAVSNIKLTYKEKRMKTGIDKSILAFINLFLMKLLKIIVVKAYSNKTK
jgi:hypothetical protein